MRSRAAYIEYICIRFLSSQRKIKSCAIYFMTSNICVYYESTNGFPRVSSFVESSFLIRGLQDIREKSTYIYIYIKKKRKRYRSLPVVAVRRNSLDTSEVFGFIPHFFFTFSEGKTISFCLFSFLMLHVGTLFAVKYTTRRKTRFRRKPG